jgi:hypothetical protein
MLDNRDRARKATLTRKSYLVSGLAWLGCTCGLALLIPACSGPHVDPLPDPTPKANSETRDFTILVDKKPAGQFRMTITQPDENTQVMAAQARVRVTRWFVTYTYQYNGTETYRDDTLIKLKSNCNDNGQKFKLLASRDEVGLHVKVNRKKCLIRSDVWTTSYWQLPAGNRGKKLTLLDADTGKQIKGQLRFVEHVDLKVAGELLACAHYRVTGPPSPVDLWYDEDKRLVRQDYVEQGHRTVLELAKISHGKVDATAPMSRKKHE